MFLSVIKSKVMEYLSDDPIKKRKGTRKDRMSRIRVIPCLDFNQGRVIKGVNFVDFKDAGDPVEIAKEYSDAGADELVFLDISATVEARKTRIDKVREIVKNISVPLTVGGGIRNIKDIADILNAGADKVGINSAAVKNSGLILDAVHAFGSQCIVVAIDAKKSENGLKWTVCINGGKTDTGIDAIGWAMEAEIKGAGEILLTSVDRDGTKDGYDIELLKTVTENISIPVIASGGAGEKEHFLEAIKVGGADAVLAASLFHFKDLSIMEVKKYLLHNGLDVHMLGE
jgi:cyclase